MACTIMDQGLPNVSQVYGCEISLYYPDKYAGKADVIGVHNDDLSIMDFKQSNRPKQKAWITDYFLQLAAYATAHNQVHGTSINSGTILMCTKDNYFQKFTVQGAEFQQFMWDWLRRVDLYYNNLDKKVV